LKQFDGALRKRNGPRIAVLGQRQEGYPAFQVYIPPAQRQQFASAHPGLDGQQDQWAQIVDASAGHSCE
jgi:hypothetical protein